MKKTIFLPKINIKFLSLWSVFPHLAEIWIKVFSTLIFSQGRRLKKSAWVLREIRNLVVEWKNCLRQIQWMGRPLMPSHITKERNKKKFITFSRSSMLNFSSQQYCATSSLHPHPHLRVACHPLLLTHASKIFLSLFHNMWLKEK